MHSCYLFEFKCSCHCIIISYEIMQNYFSYSMIVSLELPNIVLCLRVYNLRQVRVGHLQKTPSFIFYCYFSNFIFAPHLSQFLELGISYFYKQKWNEGQKCLVTLRIGKSFVYVYSTNYLQEISLSDCNWDLP